MTGKRIEVRIEDRVARIILAAPERRNAIDLAFCEAFAAAGVECAATPGLAAILVQSSGDIFSVGGDIDDFIAHEADIEKYVYRMSSIFHVGVTALARADAPLIVAVRGTVAGGAISLMAGADMAVAAQSTRICAAFTRSGLTPDGGATYTLTRLVGYQRAFDILATNPVLTGEEAVKLGLACRLFADADFDSELCALLEKMRSMPAAALWHLKRLMRQGMGASLEEQLASEARAIAASAGRPATMMQLKAFLERSGRGSGDPSTSL
jgi:2-(1,2-epoxy-1,2-dihydrophenyl)acetyl-CoA isomerase